MTRLSGFKPTGSLQFGNYVGAIRPMVDAQRPGDVVMICDLHALTVEHDPARVRALTFEVAAVLLAAGVDPDACVCYVQSHVPEHTELHYLLEATTTYGEARRMIQFKERASAGVRLALLTYPVLMAADILMFGTTEVPVGHDQRQHVELARTVAHRFNGRYGDTFTLPRAVYPAVAARVMDLTDPVTKMGKTNSSPAGVLFVLDPPEVLRRKVRRAVTDDGTGVVHDPARRPGVSNLLEILGACLRADPATLAGGFGGYGDLKVAVADAVVDALAPVQARYREIVADPDLVRDVLRDGAKRARETAAATVARARTAIGLLAA